jgi:hypothetical protein
MAVSQLGQLDNGPTLLSIGFNPGCLHIRFVVDEMALE